MSSDSAAPGWDAIEQACAALYPGRDPLHFAAILGYRQGGPDPLDGIHAFKVLAPVPHWHFVSFGLSELYEKEADNLAVSGHGIELTFRLACAAHAERPPEWAINFLQNLARYVVETGNVYHDGLHFSAHGPLSLDEPTALTALLFAADPQLPDIATPNGVVRFLQAVGLTDDELHAVQSWNVPAFRAVLAEAVPLLVTDLARPSLLNVPARATRIRTGQEHDGSATESLSVRRLDFTHAPTELTVTLGAIAVAGLQRLVRGRLPFGRTLTVLGRGAVLVLEPADANGWHVHDRTVTLSLTMSGVAELTTLVEAKRDRYALPSVPGLTVQVVPTEITDQLGRVIETIG